MRGVNSLVRLRQRTARRNKGAGERGLLGCTSCGQTPRRAAVEGRIWGKISPREKHGELGLGCAMQPWDRRQTQPEPPAVHQLMSARGFSCCLHSLAFSLNWINLLQPLHGS